MKRIIFPFICLFVLSAQATEYPFCVVSSLGRKCIYSDIETCQSQATYLKGVCVVNDDFDNTSNKVDPVDLRPDPERAAESRKEMNEYWEYRQKQEDDRQKREAEYLKDLTPEQQSSYYAQQEKEKAELKKRQDENAGVILVVGVGVCLGLLALIFAVEN